jgi:hypothetical protein
MHTHHFFFFSQASVYSPLPTMLPVLSPDMQINGSLGSIHHDLTPSTIEPAATYSSAVSAAQEP